MGSDLEEKTVENLEDKVEIPGKSGDKKIKSERIFNQEELDNVVKQRLLREESRFTTLKQQYEAEKTQFEATIQTYEEQINKILEPQLNNVPDAFKPLFDKLSVVEKLDWLSKNNDSLLGDNKKFINETPRDEKNVNGFKPNTKNVFRM
jgi:hypothetical protein